jgi:hypothetical protein
MDAVQEWRAWEEFPKRAKAFGLDVRKIVDQVAPVEPPAAASGSAEKKASTKKRDGKQ